MFPPAPGSEGRATWAAGAHDPRPSRPPTPPRVTGRQSPTARALGPSWPGQASELALMLWTPQPPPTLLTALEPVCGFPPGTGAGDPCEPRLLGPPGRCSLATFRGQGTMVRLGAAPAHPEVSAGPVTGPSGHVDSSGRQPDVASHDKPTTPAQRGSTLVGPVDLAQATNSLCGLLPWGLPRALLGCGLPRSWFCIWGLRGPIISCPGDSGRGSRVRGQNRLLPRL